MKLRLLDMDEVTKHELSRNIGHPAMTWTFSMLVTGRSGSGKTNLLANLVLGDGKGRRAQHTLQIGSQPVAAAGVAGQNSQGGGRRREV